eukprot:TRINITY_DN803_c0_g5_i1.p1 TRINITY_DN803_c0_g5~~TRINITY_DN803_c0_g5_i1.p1  ORF type:complete len:232 (-),score=58.05 TRINITY_DN803_c0_g5_i1:418-1113(-)
MIVARELSAGAATSDRFGFLVGGEEFEATLRTPLDLMLFDRNLEPVDVVRVLSQGNMGSGSVWHDESRHQSGVYRVGAGLVVVTLRVVSEIDFAEVVTEDSDIDFVLKPKLMVTAFRIFSVPLGASNIVDLRDEFQGEADLRVNEARLLVCTSGLRVYCFSPDAALLWTYTVPNRFFTTRGLSMAWRIRFDANDMFLVGLHPNEDPDKGDARVLRLSYDPPATDQALSLDG